MANTAYSVNGVIVDFDARDTVPQFTLMQPGISDYGIVDMSTSVQCQ